VLKKAIPYIGLLAVIFAVIVCYLYFNMFSGELSTKQSDWAAFGSYIGGTVGALFASLSFIILLYTVVLQRQELTTAINALEDGANSQRKQVENYEAQKFETTFYSLLELHNQAVRELNIQENEFSTYVETIEAITESDVNKYLSARQDKILNNVELSQYFRILYQLLKFIAKNNVKNKNKVFDDASLGDRKTIDDYQNEEKIYASLVRSFVPVKLLPVLALNCMPTYGGLNNLPKYWSLLERYSFLEHMHLDRLALNLSKFLIFDRYSYAMGEKGSISDNVKEIKLKYPQYFTDELMEGGYLHTYANHV
jgi:hypothetical protein